MNSDKLYKAELASNITSEGSQTLGQVAVVSGLLACGKHQLLCAPLSAQSQDVNMFQWMFSVICDLCKGQHQYHAFQLIVQWYRKVADILDQVEANFNSQSAIVKSTMEVVWTNLDSPVEGVNAAVMEVFDLLLSICEIQKSVSQIHIGEDKNLPCADMVDAIMEQVLHMSWHVKGKHRLVATLLKHVNVNQVSTGPFNPLGTGDLKFYQSPGLSTFWGLFIFFN